MYSFMHWLLHLHKAITGSDDLIAHNIYECLMNAKYLCTCLETI